MTEEAVSLAKRLPLVITDWLSMDEPEESWIPPKIALNMVRIGLIKYDDKEGGYLLTSLGKQVRFYLTSP